MDRRKSGGGVGKSAARQPERKSRPIPVSPFKDSDPPVVLNTKPTSIMHGVVDRDALLRAIKYLAALNAGMAVDDSSNGSSSSVLSNRQLLCAAIRYRQLHAHFNSVMNDKTLSAGQPVSVKKKFNMIKSFQSNNIKRKIDLFFSPSTTT